MTTKEQLKKFLEYKGISPTGLEKILGWGVGAFTKAKSITADRVQEVALHFSDLSLDWLIRGEGNMVREPATAPASTLDRERLEKLVDTIATLQSVINDKSETIALLNQQIKQLENKQK